MGCHSKRESDSEDDGHVGDSRNYLRGDGSYRARTPAEEAIDARADRRRGPQPGSVSG